ncbi:hypothetical protein MXD63_41505, partial [Frankia sp. Cpl3]|nr:hypothetical protein [Frankia sp. Cpl3]
IMEAKGVFPEMAQAGYVLLAASTGTSEADVESVGRVLESLQPTAVPDAELLFQPGVLASCFLREQIIPMHEALDAGKRTIPLEAAEGTVCAEMVIPYPPGIPLLVPGERIDTEALTLLHT